MDFVFSVLAQGAQSALPGISGVSIALAAVAIGLITNAVILAYRGGQLAQRVTDIGDDLHEMAESSKKNRQDYDVRLRELENTAAELAVMLRGISNNAREIEKLRMRMEGLILQTRYGRTDPS